MPKNSIENVTTLTFDIFGTVLDLAGSLSFNDYARNVNGSSIQSSYKNFYFE